MCCRASKRDPHLVSPHFLWGKTKEILGDTAIFYGEIESVPEEKILIAKEGLKIDLGNNIIRVLETPGHASHSVTYYLQPQKLIFPGETLGVYLEPWGVFFPTTPKPFNATKAFNSIEKIRKIDPITICFPHYGAKSNAPKYIERYRQKLEIWIKTVEKNLSQPLDIILKLLQEKDPSMQTHYSNIIRHKIWSGSIARSIEGIRSYINWKKAQQSSLLIK